MEGIIVRLVMRGNVQGVGYRAYVKQVARNLGIRGHARNLDDGGVEIYCEAPNKKALEEFKKKIDLKGNPEEPFSLHVERIQEFSEKTKEFKPGKNAFKGFWIDYGKADIQREILEKTEIGGLILHGMNNTLHEFKGESKTSFEKLEKTMHGVDHTLTEFKNQANQKLDDVNQTMTRFKDQTVGNFSSLDVKYGTVSGSLDKINENLEKLTTAIQQAIKSINPNH